MGCHQTKQAEPVGESVAEDDLADVINPAPLGALYELGEIIGQSGASVVHLATRRADGARVAIKMVPKSAGECSDALGSDFVREVRVMLRLRHAHVLGLLDVFDEPSRSPVLGSAEAGIFTTCCRVPVAASEGRPALITLLSAIAYMHDEGVITATWGWRTAAASRNAARAIVKIADFGFAKPTDALALAPPPTTTSSRRSATPSSARSNIWPQK